MHAHDGYERFTEAVKLADHLLNLRHRSSVRMLAVVSDGKRCVADTRTGARLRPANGLEHRRIVKDSEVVGDVVAAIRDEDRSTIAS
ncbi:hypothetical protein KZZ52_16035 [Dactylosporangium sp. AC04546]|uniref:hypothetical protein n=1 Tax=Dactylosporangium sp. AC04546 TaxID=2862460 RepID=UPI001EE1260A|nr:hypothetical protein [Dactylosporangium sp. AC04546]WVK86813.1 hypothetical protein KZZ52_16035 [Dactylosporangium sp. AC04546]